MEKNDFVKTVLFLSAVSFILISGCSMMNEYTIEDTTWKLSSVSLLSSTLWDDDFYRFKDGNGKLTHTNSSSVGTFKYSMSSNVIKISNSGSSSSGLAANSYKIYKYNNEMIWYNSDGIECYRFEED